MEFQLSNSPPQPAKNSLRRNYLAQKQTLPRTGDKAPSAAHQKEPEKLSFVLTHLTDTGIPSWMANETVESCVDANSCVVHDSQPSSRFAFKLCFGNGFILNRYGVRRKFCFFKLMNRCKARSIASVAFKVKATNDFVHLHRHKMVRPLDCTDRLSRPVTTAVETTGISNGKSSFEVTSSKCPTRLGDLV